MRTATFLLIGAVLNLAVANALLLWAYRVEWQSFDDGPALTAWAVPVPADWPPWQGVDYGAWCEQLFDRHRDERGHLAYNAEMRLPDDAPLVTTLVRVRSPGVTTIEQTLSTAFQDAPKDRSYSMRDFYHRFGGGRNWSFVLFRGGWPLHAFVSGTKFASGPYVPGGPFAPGKLQVLGVDAPGWLAPAPHHWFMPRQLMYAPIWPGFVANTILYATALWSVFALAHLPQRVWRGRRGRCGTCGYSRAGLAPAAPCPECGRP